MNHKQVELLQQAYLYPDKKFCYYSGKNNPKAAEILGLENWDWTPQNTVNIEPWYWNTHTLALAFGCPVMLTSEGKEWIKPLLNDPGEIDKLKVPELYSGRTGQILDSIKRILDNYPEESLVRLPDIQSPLGVAELIMGEALYFALLTESAKIHDLLLKITDFIIPYISEIKNICKSRFNPACHPQVWSDPIGYYISDDANSMVSPEMHEEFSVEYINRITAELGPVFYHTCTWTEAYLENIRKVNNKKLVNWSTGTSMDPALIIQENSGKVLMAPHIGAGTHREGSLVKAGLDFQDEAELLRYLLDNMQDNSTLYLSFEESLFEQPDIFRKIYNHLSERGYTP